MTKQLMVVFALTGLVTACEFDAASATGAAVYKEDISLSKEGTSNVSGDKRAGDPKKETSQSPPTGGEDEGRVKKSNIGKDSLGTEF